MTRHVIKPIEATVATAGPKAEVLARATAAGLPVPPFAVVVADAYRQHAARAGVKRGDTAAAREAILGTALAFDLGMQLTAVHRRLGPALAVRSSGTAEDLPGLSFAGQYETTLDVTADGLDRAVLECWASVWGERAVAYRERNGVPHESAAMAVIVQRMVAPELGGVAFTTDPVSGKPDIVVESCPEGAEAIVSGRVTPARHAFKRKELVREMSADPAPGGEGAATLTLADVPRAAAHLALAAEDLLECPVDVEWAYADGRLWLLQARPITASATARAQAPAPAAPDARKPEAAAAPAPVAPSAPEPVRYRPTAWSNVNTGEVLPGVVTPMTWSVVGKLAMGLIDALFGKLGIRLDSSRLTGLIAGRAYFNASLLGSAFEQIPLRGDEDITSIFGGADAPAGFTDLPIAPEDTARVSTLRLIAGVPLVAVYFLRHSPRAADRLGRAISEEAGIALAGIASARDEEALAQVTERVIRGLDTMVDAVAFSGVAMALHGQFVTAAKKHFGDKGPALANTLLAGQGGVASADAGLALARLGRLGRTERAVGDVLRSSEVWAEVRPALEALGGEGEAFLAEWDAFIAEHGHHARGELEFGSPRWAECPDDVLAMVVGLLDVPLADDIVSAHQARGERAAEEEKRALAALGPVARMRFRWLLRNARAGARTRENVKNDGVRVLAAARQALLAVGGAMAERGVLTTADDILFLTWEELPSVRAGSLDPAPLVAARRAEYVANRALTPPPVVIGDWDGRAVAPDLDTPFAPDTLTGLGVAAGVATGPARVIHSLESVERVLPGEVLVAPFTDPGWTPYFIPAAAIVVDMGGMLSHGSIIAREYGIPAVVNVGPATSIIRTGDIVEVDGSRGVVTVIERAARAEG